MSLSIEDYLATRRREVEALLEARVPAPGGLEGDPGHPIWKRDYLGCTGLFGVELAPCSDRQLAAFVDSLELFALGYSWGGYDSLVVPQNIQKSRSVRPWSGALMACGHCRVDMAGASSARRHGSYSITLSAVRRRCSGG